MEQPKNMNIQNLKRISGVEKAIEQHFSDIEIVSRNFENCNRVLLLPQLNIRQNL